jgi:[ribosomal protein S5]-alanine N-acetyltransferase
MTIDRRSLGHPSMPATTGLHLYGKRVMLRPLLPRDFDVYREVRAHNEQWLTVWEPTRPSGATDPTRHRDAFNARCAARDRDRHAGLSYGFGVFVDSAFAGEVNINGVMRGATQSCTIGYWIDQRHAGHRYIPEAVVALVRFAFEELSLHRVEIGIIPRNVNSRRVMEVLQFRDEGIALRLIEINGVWEDHMRFAITAEEWTARGAELARTWLV